MSKELIDYSILVDNAMHLIVKKSLQIFAASEDRGEHHFFISFVTKHKGVVISDKLHKKYPYEMTIVLQHQFEELQVEEDYFSVYLSFNNEKEKIVIPFSALTAFADPSVKFGLQFRHVEENKEDSHLAKLQEEVKEGSLAQSNNSVEAEENVIALDFKNKKRL